MLTFGPPRTCWKCNYVGPFHYSLFFAGLFVVSLFTVAVLSYFVFAATRHNWVSNNHMINQMFGGWALAVGLLLWLIQKRNTFFFCPQCGMPEASSTDSKG